MDAKQIEIWVHEEDFATPAETDGGTQRFQVEKIIMHPYYNRRTIDNDIAVSRWFQYFSQSRDMTVME
jgi:secreted trypsin-like serine protease